MIKSKKSPKILYWVLVGFLLGVTLVAIGWFLGKKQVAYNPYQELEGFKSSRHVYLVKSSEISVKLANKAVEALKNKNIKEALEDCKTAIDIFPIDAKPYILLAKLYLMTGQEPKMFETLTLAGRSYPNFDNIVSVIDDENLDRLPLDEPQGSIYLSNFPENKQMAVSFLFDDGEKDVYVNALPVFEKYGFRATIPVVAGYVADSDKDPFWGSWSDWKDAANRGFEIANHSMYHRDSQKLHGSDFDISIDQAKDMIETKTGHKVTAYVFPHDSYNDEAVSRALKHHEVIRSWEFLRSFYNRTVSIVYGGPHFSVKTADRLIDIAIKRHLWLVGNCHGVTTKRGILSFKSITPAFLEAHLAYIHSRSKEVWVDTFSNIFEYMSLRSRAKIETKTFTENSIDFVLHSNGMEGKLTEPLTVVIKTEKGVILKSASGAEGHILKAWPCAENQVCVDADSYDENIHVLWGNPPAAVSS
jgi:peptidoglycan/xylan/chitin deacetylase (PgdA/CDA1 family)